MPNLTMLWFSWLAVSYIGVGLLIAELSPKAFRERNSWLSYLLYPFLSYITELGWSDNALRLWLETPWYKVLHLLLWPLRVGWNILLLILIGVHELLTWELFRLKLQRKGKAGKSKLLFEERYREKQEELAALEEEAAVENEVLAVTLLMREEDRVGRRLDNLSETLHQGKGAKVFRLDDRRK